MQHGSAKKIVGDMLSNQCLILDFIIIHSSASCCGERPRF